MTPQRDRLFLLQPGFADPAFPDQIFYCWHCALLEGVLASFPDHARLLEVVRIAWPRPREALVALVGAENQSVPLLALAEGAPEGLETGRHGPVRFVAGKDAILSVLSARHGFPAPHP
jgi:hypothetical protein